MVQDGTPWHACQRAVGNRPPGRLRRVAHMAFGPRLVERATGSSAKISRTLYDRENGIGPFALPIGRYGDQVRAADNGKITSFYVGTTNAIAFVEGCN